MQTQLTHKEFKQIQQHISNDIIFILDKLEYSENIGAAFRLADAFNITKLIIVTAEKLNTEKIKKTARSCEKKVDFELCLNIDDALKIVEKAGFTPVNLEITSTSKPISQIDFKTLGKIALIVGNEKHGVSEEALNKVALSVHINMYGNNSSMNVISALSIATYKISEDLNRKKA